jgi:hypothetical protein
MNGVKLTGLWKNTSKEGKSFLSGTLGGVKVLVFPNEFKRGETDPDYNLFISPKEEKKTTEPATTAGPF